jgi:hypothetical protein
MTEQLITFETAKLAKEKGLPQLNSGIYYTKDKEHCLVGWGIDNIREYSAPTQSLLQKWILEKHGYFVTVELVYLQWGKYSATVQKESEEGSVLATTVLDGFTVYDNPESALEEGLRETLKLIKDELVR